MQQITSHFTAPNKEKIRQEFPLIWNVPACNDYFCGRKEELGYIAKNFESSREIYIAQAITGIGGIGKSRLAKEYAYSHRKRYQLVWWINCESTQTIDDCYSELANEISNKSSVLISQPPIHPIQIKKQNPDQIREWVMLRLREIADCLLIFDNATDKKSLMSYLPSFSMFAAGYNHIVITSQNENWQIGQLLPVQLGLLNPEESKQLLHHWIKGSEAESFIPEEDELATELSDLLSNFPLALAQAGAYIQENRNVTLEDYIKLYKKAKNDLTLLKDKRFMYLPDYQHPLVVTWEISLKKIETKYPDARILLEYCSYLASRNIPEIFLRKLPEFSNYNDENWNELLHELSIYSFISGRSEKKLINFLPLFQEVIRKINLSEQSSSPYKTASVILRAIVGFLGLTLINYLLQKPMSFSESILCTIIYTIFHEILNEIAPRFKGETLYKFIFVMCLLGIAVAYYYGYPLHTTLYIMNILQSLSYATRRLQSLQTRASMLALCMDGGDISISHLEALTHYIPERIEQWELEAWLGLFNTLTLFYMMNGRRLNKAKSIAEMALKICDQLSEKEKQSEMKATFSLHLGNIYMAMNNIISAQQHLENAQSFSTNIKGEPQFTSQVTSLLFLVCLNLGKGNVSQAKDLLTKAEIVLKTKNHPELNCFFMLVSGIFYYHLGNCSTAEGFINESIKLEETAHSNKQHNFLKQIIGFMLLYQDEPVYFYQKVSKIIPLLQDNHDGHCDWHDDPNEVNALCTIFISRCIEQKDWLKAKQYAKEILQRNQRFYGHYHYSVAEVLTLLISICHNENKNEGAIYTEQLNFILEMKNLLSVPQQEQILFSLAQAHSLAENFPEAEAAFLKALTFHNSTSQKKNKAFYTIYTEILVGLGYLYLRTNKFIQSIQKLEDALCVINEQFPELPRKGVVLEFLAIGYRFQHNLSEEEHCLVEALQISKDRWGDNHHITAYHFFRLGEFYFRSNKLSQSKELLLIAFKIYDEKHITDNLAAEMAFLLGYCYEKSGDFSSSISYFERYLALTATWPQSERDKIKDFTNFLSESIKLKKKIKTYLPRVLQRIKELTTQFKKTQISNLISLEQLESILKAKKTEDVLESKKDDTIRNNDKYKSGDRERAAASSSSPRLFKRALPISEAMLTKYGLSNNSQESLERGLRMAAHNERVADVKIFIQCVENINAQDSNPKKRFTALHLAAMKGNKEIIQLLLKANALANIKDASGQTAEDYAEQSGKVLCKRT